MDIVIDIGNFRQKIAIFSPTGESVDYQIYQTLTPQDIHDICKKYHVKRSLLSNVAEKRADLELQLMQMSDYHYFSLDSKLSIQLHYQTGETLGLDRIACAVAAQQTYPNSNCLVIQAGTCLVFDFVDEQGVYWGGAIAPGLNMRFQALHHFTANLPIVEKENINYFIGNSTQQSIKSGVINGIIYEIEGFMTAYQQQYSNLKVLITGGDCTFLLQSLKNAIFADSNFVLKGLHKILQLNAKNGCS